ncbi:unnamed protein product [Moneuplotes crassus]|uniref:Uncharacterized protein n=1 Tax=Euplotes crassus TaxID=5936 RepID=A0AAD1X6J9_EUPCR|nr:unnamed protein product [Moneuplotes crassus]
MFQDIFKSDLDFTNEFSQTPELFRKNSDEKVYFIGNTYNPDFQFEENAYLNDEVLAKKPSLTLDEAKQAGQDCPHEATCLYSQCLRSEGLPLNEINDTSFFTLPKEEFLEGNHKCTNKHKISKEGREVGIYLGDNDSQVKTDILNFDKVFEEITHKPDSVTTNVSQAELTGKRTRWKKQDDIELFKEFRMCEEQGLITLNEIRNFQNSSEIQAHAGMQMIKQTLGCRQSPKFLANRIKIKMKDTFSVRETKILKKLVKQYNYTCIPYQKLLAHFSGKTLEGLERACDNLCESKKHRMLTRVQQA